MRRIGKLGKWKNEAAQRYYEKHRHEKQFRNKAAKRAQEWAREHPKQVKQYTAQRYERHRAKILARARTYYKLNSRLVKEKAAKYRNTHREYYRKYFRKYLKINRAKRNRMHAQYRRENGKQIKEAKRRAYFRRRRYYIKKAKMWSKTAKGIATSKVMVARRRSRMRNDGDLTTVQWQVKVARYKHRCARCRRSRKLELHHIKPLSQGGRNTIRNVLPLCGPCHKWTHRQLKKK